MTRIKSGLSGGALALIAVVAIHFPFAEIAVPLLSLFLALTACVYLGALLAQRQSPAVVISEFAVGLSVFLCAILGTLVSAGWLAAGYGIHGIWDWAHDAGHVTTRVSSWFPPACAIFDIIIAIFVMLFVT